MQNYNLERFVTAQKGIYFTALQELQRGRKDSHWMWFIFPQVKGLGRSAASEYYGISGLDEATAYMEHPVLGPRLTECAWALLQHKDKTASEIMGHIDAMKLRSSMTLFREAAPENPLFDAVLNAFYNGEPDHRTQMLLRRY